MPHDFDLNPEALNRLWTGYIQTGGDLVAPEVIWPEMEGGLEMLRHSLRSYNTDNSLVDSLVDSLRDHLSFDTQE